MKPTSTSRIASAAASTNATSAKAAPGHLFSVHAYNASAAAKYLKVYDKAAAPTVGTDTPVLTLAIAATSHLTLSFSEPLEFGKGIAYALTGAAADSDTTALTAADVTGLNLIYR